MNPSPLHPTGVDSDSFVSDWTTDTDADAQYETVILRSAQTDKKQLYPKMKDLFTPSNDDPGVGGAISTSASPASSRPTSGLLAEDAALSSTPASPRLSGECKEEEGEQLDEGRVMESGGTMEAETTDDQAFLIKDEAQV